VCDAGQGTRGLGDRGVGRVAFRGQAGFNRRALTLAHNPATLKGRFVHNVQGWCARGSKLNDGRAIASR